MVQADSVKLETTGPGLARSFFSWSGLGFLIQVGNALAGVRSLKPRELNMFNHDVRHDNNDEIQADE